jgi:hypothetical protein
VWIETFEQEITLVELEDVATPIHASGSARAIGDGPHDDTVLRPEPDLFSLHRVHQRCPACQTITESKAFSPEVEELARAGRSRPEHVNIPLRVSPTRIEQRGRGSQKDNGGNRDRHPRASE